MFQSKQEKQNNEVQRLAVLLGLSVPGTREFLKRASGFLAKRKNFSQKNLIDSFFILEEIRGKEAEDLARTQKRQYSSKNIYIIKYQEEISDMYEAQGFGYLKISKQLKLYHNVDVSKSTIERFIKDNNLTKKETR